MSQALVTRSLAECEATIERGLATFIEIGQALAAIREQRLYRESFQTFEDYCCERWDMRREGADRFIRAAEVVRELNPIGLPAPQTEAVARELVPLRNDPDQLREVWSEISSNGKPTAAAVREAVQERVSSDKPEPPHTFCPACGRRVRADLPSPRGGEL